ncbi:MAG: hypothetical protein GX657_18690 [Chloroflexi bacterium]|nr:hypothetical protein [Chloroflexota bacterium]
MSRTNRPIVLYDPALPQDAQYLVKRQGPFDVVVGIPSHRNARTIAEVVAAASEGIATYLPDQRVLLMNADGGSSDNTCRFLEDLEAPANVTKLVCVYDGAIGKGNGVRAIMEAAALSDARACALLDARCPGIAPEWLPALVNPVLGGGDMVVATYDRSPVASALTDNLAYPFVRLFFNANLREPLAAEVCMSGALTKDLVMRDVWETDVSRFGVNIWLIMQALADNRRLVQVDLGPRGDARCEPGVLGDLRFLHMVGTLFRFLAVYPQVWQQDLPPRAVPLLGARPTGLAESSSDAVEPLVAGFREGCATMGEQWRQVLTEETLAKVLALQEQPADQMYFTKELWADVVIRFAVVYNRGEGDPDRVAEALLPLFYGRAATYVRQVDGLLREQREPVVEQIVRTFVERRHALANMWDSYRPWADADGPLADY